VTNIVMDGGRRSRCGRGGVAGLDVGCMTLSVVDSSSQTASDELGSGVIGPGAQCGELGGGGAEEEGSSSEELGPRVLGVADVLDFVATLSGFGLDSMSGSGEGMLTNSDPKDSGSGSTFG